MNYRSALAALIIFGSVAVYAEVPSYTPETKKEEAATTDVKKVDTDVVKTEPKKKAKERADEENTTQTVFDEGNVKTKEKKTKKQKPKEILDPETKALQQAKKKLSMRNSLRNERLKNENADLLARLQKIKWEKQIIAEQLDLEDLKRERDRRDETLAYQDELSRLTREASLAKARATKLSSELNARQTEWDARVSKLNSEIEVLKIKKERDIYADREPIYLDNPLKDENTLVISDRRIALNGPILSDTADYITTRINYYNNKEGNKPIFIVIDSSPGGSVMAGYRILKAMEGSKAPIFVVVKSFAASMAATMVTLAKQSFAYPNAILLHHQISSTFFFTRLNLTQQKEFYEESKKWWQRLASPVASKMGITTREFIKKMYKHSSDGDWTEFATEAKKLKWVDHIVDRIEETSLLKDPNSEKSEVKKDIVLAEVVDKKGKPVVYLPRLSPKDMYFMYNPDQYYQLR